MDRQTKPNNGEAEMRYNLYRQMVVHDKDDDITWITVRGRHIPIKEGQTKEDAIKEAFNKSGENAQKTDTKKSEKSSAQPKKDSKPLDNDKKSAISNSGGGKIPKQYHTAYKQMMDTVHKSAETEVSTADAINAAVALSEKLGKGITREAIEARMKRFEEYGKKAKLVDTDIAGQKAQVDTKIKYSTGGKFVDGEYVGGEYTPERKKIQDDIINKLFVDIENKLPAKGEKPKLVILGGRGGSGKSHFTKGDNAQYPASKFVVIDPDSFKEQLPEYKDLVDKGSKYAGLNAWEVHEESSDMKKDALRTAMLFGANTVLDGTLAKTKSVLKVIDEFEKAGYDVEGAYMHLPREKSTARGILRGMGNNETGRMVPPKQLLGMKNNEDNFEELMPRFKKWTIYNNDVPMGEKPKLVAKSE